MPSDPVARLAELMREVSRHRHAIEQFRLSAYLEKEALHELRLLSLYVEIRKHCRTHGLLLPRDYPRE